MENVYFQSVFIFFHYAIVSLRHQRFSLQYSTSRELSTPFKVLLIPLQVLATPLKVLWTLGGQYRPLWRQKITFIAFW